MKKIFFAVLLCLVAVLIAAPAYAAKRVVTKEAGVVRASSNISETADGLLICDPTTTTQCVVVTPASLPTGSTKLYAPFSVSASASALTSAITGTEGAAVTSGPTLTVTQPGTYSLSGTISTTFAAATFAANQNVSCWMYRTNNTPGALTNSTSRAAMPVMTTETVAGPSVLILPVSYTTANSDDTIEVYCAISANPGAGAINVTGVSLLGVRFK